LALAEHLAQTQQAKLILIARPNFPRPDTWQNHLDTHEPDDAITQTIQRLRAIVAQGHGMLFLCADVTDLTQMQQAIDQAHAAFGDIQGVFHTAEVKGSGLMQLKTPEQIATVLDSKVKGTLTLEAALANAELDFFVLFSSTSSLLGGLGQVETAASHAFLDAYAHHKTEQGRYTVAINWGTWQWDDWLETQSAGVPEFQQQLRHVREQYGISFREGMEALSLILASTLPQVVVSTQDFHTVMKEQGTVTAAGYLEAVEEARRGQEHEHAEDRTYLAPTNETEQTLAELWQEIFGVKRVSLHDNFFELGGNSLVAIQLITRMRQKFKVDFPINVIFESPSVEGLAQVIASKQLDQEKLDKLEQMLREIEALSLQEVKSKLESN
jgi:phthiocerol/phenolphthiocerol synthesis type-I polyketide synthase E